MILAAGARSALNGRVWEGGFVYMRGWLALALRLILLWRVALVGGRKAKGMQRILPWKKRRMDRLNQIKKVSGERDRDIEQRQGERK